MKNITKSQLKFASLRRKKGGTHWYMVFYLTYWVMGFCSSMAIISYYPITL